MRLLFEVLNKVYDSSFYYPEVCYFGSIVIYPVLLRVRTQNQKGARKLRTLCRRKMENVVFLSYRYSPRQL
jgi:hypothetical protein